MRSRTTRILLMGLVLASVLPSAANGAVLYDQTNFPGAGSINSNEFPGAPAQTNQAADDFRVPAGQIWRISGVDVTGLYSPMVPPPSVNAFIHENAGYGAAPGTELFRQLSITSGGGPNYQVPLTGAPELKPETYWVSIQQAGATFMQPSWDWRTRTVQSGYPFMYRQPNSGSAAPCQAMWTAFAVCFPGTEPDLLFRLNGTASSEPVTFGMLNANKKKGTAELTVNIPGPGAVDLAGNGLSPRHLARRSVSAAGQVKLLIKATGKKRGKLNRTGKVKVTATVTYTATGATPSISSRKVKLRKR